MEQALREVRRVLKAGGKASLLMWYHRGIHYWIFTYKLSKCFGILHTFVIIPLENGLVCLIMQGLFVQRVQSFRLALEFTSWVERMRTPKALVEAIRHYQGTLVMR